MSIMSDPTGQQNPVIPGVFPKFTLQRMVTYKGGTASEVNEEIIITAADTRKVSLTSYVESFEATWETPERAFGRLNPDYRYAQTNRRVDISFNLPAINVAEARGNLDFCHRLADKTYGKYTSASGKTVFGDPRYRYEGANDFTFRVDFGGLLQNEVCFVRNFNMSINFDAGVFEYSANKVQGSEIAGESLGIGEYQTSLFDNNRAELPPRNYVYHDAKGKVFPKEISVNISLIILHNYPLGFGGRLRPAHPLYWASPSDTHDWPHSAGPTFLEPEGTDREGNPIAFPEVSLLPIYMRGELQLPAEAPDMRIVRLEEAREREQEARDRLAAERAINNLLGPDGY